MVVSISFSFSLYSRNLYVPVGRPLVKTALTAWPSSEIFDTRDLCEVRLVKHKGILHVGYIGYIGIT